MFALYFVNNYFESNDHKYTIERGRPFRLNLPMNSHIKYNSNKLLYSTRTFLTSRSGILHISPKKLSPVFVFIRIR